MCAGIVDKEKISDLYFRQHSVDSEFIIVFA